MGVEGRYRGRHCLSVHYDKCVRIVWLGAAEMNNRRNSGGRAPPRPITLLNIWKTTTNFDAPFSLFSHEFCLPESLLIWSCSYFIKNSPVTSPTSPSVPHLLFSFLFSRFCYSSLIHSCFEFFFLPFILTTVYSNFVGADIAEGKFCLFFLTR